MGSSSTDASASQSNPSADLFVGLWSCPRDYVPVWSVVLLGLVAMLVQVPALWAEYSFDDSQALLGHGAVMGTQPLSEVWTRDWFGRPLDGSAWSSSWRPLTTLTMAICQRWLAAAWLQHLVNLGLYAAVTVSVFLVARRFMTTSWAWLVAVVFAVLPVHVEAVSSIVGRAELLAGLFCLLSVLAVSAPWSLGRRCLWACLCYLAALLAKESVALFPAVLGWLWFAARRATGDPSWCWLKCRELRLCFLVGLVGLCYLGLRSQLLPVGIPEDYAIENNVLMDRSGLPRITGNVELTGRYLGFVLWPAQLCADHTYGDFNPGPPSESLASVWLWLGFAGLLTALVDGVRTVRGRSSGLYVAAFLAGLLACQWLIPLSVIVAERLAFWPSIWCCIAVAASCSRRWPGLGQPMHRPSAWLRPPALTAFVLALVCAGGYRSWQRAGDWQNDAHLFAAQVRDCPNSVHGHYMYARVLQGQGQHAASLWHYVVSAHLNEQFPATPKLGAYAQLAHDIEDPETRILELPQLHGLGGDPGRYWRHVHQFCEGLGATGNADYLRRRFPEAIR